MKLLAGFVYILMITSCAPFERPNSLYIDPAFQYYVTLFETEAAARGFNIKIVNLIMIFSDQFNGTNTLAECETWTDRTPVIRIGTEFWNDYQNESTREQVIDHELGHCILNRDHKDTYVNMGSRTIPSSIMATYLFSDFYFDTYRDYYLDELFGLR